MTSMKKLFNFLSGHTPAEHACSAAAGIATAGGAALVIGLQTGYPMFALVGHVLYLGTIAVGTPVLWGRGGDFKPGTFVAATALALTAAFGVSAALPQPAPKAPAVASQSRDIAAAPATPSVLYANQKAPQAPRVTAAL